MLTANSSPHEIDSHQVSEWHQYALQEALAAMAEAGIAQPAELESVKQTCFDKWNRGLDCDPLFELTCIQEPDPSQLEAVIEHNALMLSNAYYPNILPAPFAHKMMTPNGFYEKHEPVYHMAKSFRCPILFNEDTDVIGVGSINPVITVIFAQAIQAYISETARIKPFISKVRLSYSGWLSLCERHFSK